MFNFDENGYLLPYEKINIEPDIFLIEKYFVDDFANSLTHRKLFNNYLKYIHEFRNKITKNFTMWVNGSFISTKQNPKDIDFVVFLDYEIYEIHDKELHNFWSFALENEGLDAYLVKIYPELHPKYYTYLESMQYWEKIYKSKPIQNTAYQKGFLALSF